jgi:hypothetical protein
MYEVKAIDDSEPSVYAGPPEEKTDLAWQALLRCRFKH